MGKACLPSCSGSQSSSPEVWEDCSSAFLTMLPALGDHKSTLESLNLLGASSSEEGDTFLESLLLSPKGDCNERHFFHSSSNHQVPQLDLQQKLMLVIDHDSSSGDDSSSTRHPADDQSIVTTTRKRPNVESSPVPAKKAFCFMSGNPWSSTQDVKPFSHQDFGPALNTNGKPRAKRGSATDPQSVYARHRRERINERLKTLQHLVPNGAKVDIVTMLEEAIHYVKFLQLQVRLLSSDEYWIYAPTSYTDPTLK